MADLRESLATGLSSWLTEEQIHKLIDEILAINKRASAEFSCKSCGQRQMRWTDIPDAKAVASALTDLANQAFGRPQESSAHQDPVQFYRLTNLSELPTDKVVADPEIINHAYNVTHYVLNEDGTPVLNKDGSPRKRAGRKPLNGSG